MVVQTGQRPQKSGSGLVHFAHNGASQVPPRAWATVPQPLQVTHRCWQRSHHGWPVARDISQGAIRPQMPHSAVILGRQLLQRGPSGSRFATGMRRRQPTHSSRFAGCLIMQFGRNGRPSESRVAGSRTAPQPEQETAA
ncbi:hypothetical protein [Streptomyces hawaiiensis]|uniref:hypothetical protein n=1 Tax=Streptomyces hawaiiensis TaxID=67305 RepID=UPI003660011F